MDKTAYSIYNNKDYLFTTFDKEKADRFIENYNKYNFNESDIYPDRARIVLNYLSELIDTALESENQINNYDYFYLLTISYNKQRNEFSLINKVKRYLDKTKLKEFESVEYNEDGYNIIFPVLDEEFIIKLNENKIINQSLISKIKSTEDRLRRTIKGNILYVVFRRDPDNPSRLFETFNKEKVENFVKKCNESTTEEYDKVGYFSINFSDLELNADKFINDYLTPKKLIYINVDKSDNYKLLGSEVRYGNEDYEDLFVNIDEGSFTVTIVLSENYPINLKNYLIIEKVNRLKEKYSYLFQN